MILENYVSELMGRYEERLSTAFAPFFRRGEMTACLYCLGIPLSIERSTRIVRAGSRPERQRRRTHVGMGSRPQDFVGEAIMTRWTSVSVASGRLSRLGIWSEEWGRGAAPMGVRAAVNVAILDWKKEPNWSARRITLRKSGQLYSSHAPVEIAP
jgi:hypothetical protein